MIQVKKVVTIDGLKGNKMRVARGIRFILSPEVQLTEKKKKVKHRSQMDTVGGGKSLVNSNFNSKCMWCPQNRHRVLYK